jgi:hypothetical protein
MAKSYSTSNIIFPVGDDFSFVNADKNYKLADLLIKGIKESDKNINIFYSTLHSYL